MKSKKLNVGLIGFWGHREYFDKLISHPNVQIVSMAGYPGMEERERLDLITESDRLNVVFVENYQEMLECNSIQLCLVMAKPRYTSSIVRAVASTKKHIISEKPIAYSLTEAADMLHTISVNGVKYTSCFSLLFSPVYQKIHQMIQERQLGEILSINFTYLATGGPLYIASEPHFSIPNQTVSSLAGGECSMFSGYGILLLEWLSGKKIKSVFSRLGSYFYPPYKEKKMEDLGLISLRLEDDICGSLTLGRITTQSRGAWLSLEITGTKGYVRCQSPFNYFTVFEPYNKNSSTGDPGGYKVYYYGNGQSNTIRFIENVIESLENDQEPFLNLKRCFSTIEVLDAIYQSFAKGKEIEVERLNL